MPPAPVLELDGDKEHWDVCGIIAINVDSGQVSVKYQRYKN